VQVVAFSVIQGFASALESLCPAAYTSSQPKLCSLYALRTFVLVCLLMIPQIAIFWSSESILLALKQEPDVARDAALYLKVMSFSLPAYATYECTKKWLQGQGRFFVPAGTVFVVAPINIVVTYLLVLGPIEEINLGYIGAPISTVISIYLMAIISVLYSIFFLSKEAWGGIDRRVFQSLGLNARLGLAGTLMIGSEWWCWYFPRPLPRIQDERCAGRLSALLQATFHPWLWQLNPSWALSAL
jgi:MATE family multidrug resistance protein